MARTDYLHLGKIPFYAFTTILPICLVIELILTNIIDKYIRNLKSIKNDWVINIDQSLLTLVLEMAIVVDSQFWL